MLKLLLSVSGTLDHLWNTNWSRWVRGHCLASGSTASAAEVTVPATALPRCETAMSRASDSLKLAPHISPTPLGLDLSAELSVPVAAAPGEADLQTVALVEEGGTGRAQTLMIKRH